MPSPSDIDLQLHDWEAALDGGAFEDVFAALEGAVRRLEDGNLPLETSLRCYEIGARLAQRCNQILDQAELRVERIELMVNQLAGSPLPKVDDES